MARTIIVERKREKAIESISTVGYCIFFILLPFSVRLNNLGIIILLVLLLPHLLWDRSGAKESLKLYFINFSPLLIYYLYLLLSFLVIFHLTPNPQHLETRSGMIGIPLFLSFMKIKKKNDLIFIAISFITSVSVISITGIFSYIKYMNLYGEVSTWVLTHVILIMHRPIWGLYLLGSLILAYHLLYNQKIENKNLRVFLFSASFINFIFIILSQAKNSIVALFIISVFGFLSSSQTIKKQRKKVSFALTISLLLFVVLAATFYYYNERYFFFLAESMRISIDYRLAHWSCATSSIKEYFLFGTGTGMENVALNECYSSIGRKDLLGFGTHNQFLSLLLESGVVGLLLILIWLFQLTVKAVKDHNLTLLSWLIVIVIAMTTENIFSTQKAIFITFSTLSFILFSKEKYK